MSPIGSFFRNKWVRIILTVDILAIILIIAFSINKATQTAVLNFNIAPVDVTITVNGSGSYENTGQPLENDKNSGRFYSFAPGTYEIQISHPDLDTKTFTIDLADNSSTTITTFLSKDGDFSFYTLKDNLSSFNRLASIASAGDNKTTDNDVSAESFITDFQRNYNLYSTQLPATYSEYDNNNELIKYISVNKSDKCNVTLCVKALMNSESDRTLADSLLQGKGFNLEDFEIEYKVFY